MIYVECSTEEVLIRSIVNIPKSEIKHQSGRSKVIKQLERHTNCIGLVDEDPGSHTPQYIKQLKIEIDLPEYQIQLLYDKSRDNKLLVLQPRFEDWILKAAEEAKVDIEKYQMPNDGIRLHKIINYRLDKVQILIEDLKVKSIRLQKLGKLIKTSGG